MVSVNSSIQRISKKCSRLIQSPTAESSFGMLQRALNVNCFHHFHVSVANHTMTELKKNYENAIEATKEYDRAVSSNEQVLFMTKTWLSMVAADPLSLGQRQAKECNAQLLSSYFGNEDVASTLPVFIQSLEYMSSCFEDVLEDVKEQRFHLRLEYQIRDLEVKESAKFMHATYTNVSDTRLRLESMRPAFAESIITTYNSIYS